MAAHRLQQGEGAHHVGLDEVGSARDRAVDVALGGQVHDAVGAEIRDSRVHCSAVADVGLEEAMVVASLDNLQRCLATGISQGIDGEDVVAFVQHQITDEGRADEAGTAGHDYAHYYSLQLK